MEPLQNVCLPVPVALEGYKIKKHTAPELHAFT